jgi:hypothetical protein
VKRSIDTPERAQNERAMKKCIKTEECKQHSSSSPDRRENLASTSGSYSGSTDATSIANSLKGDILGGHHISGAASATTGLSLKQCIVILKEQMDIKDNSVPNIIKQTIDILDDKDIREHCKTLMMLQRAQYLVRVMMD